MKKKTKKISDEKKEKLNNKIHINFFTRLVLSVIVFVAFLSLGVLFLLKSLSFVEGESINYIEKSHLDYRVYLKENSFYEDEFLGKDMLYVASLIDRINVDFNYDFTSDKRIDLDFEYSIIGKLSIKDSGRKNTYFEKEYVLLENKQTELLNGNNKTINETITIDYDYYNDIANSFKTNYGIDAASDLVLYLVINKNSDSEDMKVDDQDVMLALNIPLSLRSVDVQMNYNEINNSNEVISKSNVIIDNIMYIILTVVFVIISLIAMIKMIRLLNLLGNKNSKYDKYIKKILTEYDRLIVETSTVPDIDSENIIKIKKFQELVDVRDNLKLPIMYYAVTKHQKSYFYITHNDKTYLHIVKAIDFEEKEI